MRAREILQESTSVRVNPIAVPWKFYKLGAQVSIGKYMRMSGDIVGLTQVKGNTVVWFGFERNSNGETCIVTPEEIESMQLQDSTQYTQGDIKAGWLYKQWDRARGEKRNAIAPEFLTIEGISPRLRHVPGPLHRGLALTPEQLAALRAGQDIPLYEQAVSSWSIYEGTAQVFTGRKHGIMITKVFQPGEIVINLGQLDDELNVLLTDRWSSEGEILVRGNGIGPTLSLKTPGIKLGAIRSDAFKEL